MPPGRAWLEDLLLLLAGVAAMLAAVYLGWGVLAAVAQDGMSEPIRKGLGVGAPLPIRVFRALQALPTGRGWLLAAAIVALHALVRRVVRRNAVFGDSIAWDALLSPFVTAAIVFGIGTFRSLARHEPGAPATGLAAAAVVFVTFALAGLAIALLRRFRRLRWTAAVTAALLALGVPGAHLWGRAALAAHDARCAREVTAERERRAATERPVLRGDPLDEDGAPRYRKLFEALRAGDAAARGEDQALREASDADPYAPISAEAKAVLERHRADIAALREATRCKRCQLGVDFDPVSVFGRPVTMAVRRLGAALVTEGHERAQAGDTAGAAERYLDSVRFGGDVAPGSTLSGLVAGSVEESGLKALGRLVLAGAASAALLEQIERERSLLEAGRGRLADGFRGDRLFWCDLGRTLRVSPMQAGLDEPVILPWIVPYPALAAHAVAVADPLHRRLEQALEAGDRTTWARVEAEARDRAGSSVNFMLRGLMGYSGGPLSDSSYHQRLFLSSLRPLAWFRLAGAAVSLERASASGEPASGPALSNLPADPFGNGTPLHASREGNLYRIWSVGYDGKDDGGNTDKEADIVLAARARRPASGQAAASK
jgi:hypothetical protein